MATATPRRSRARPDAAPVGPVLQHYIARFKARAGARPTIEPRDAVAVARLLRQFGHDVGRVIALVDRWFESADPFYARVGYSLRMLPGAVNRPLVEAAAPARAPKTAGNAAVFQRVRAQLRAAAAETSP